MAENFFTMAHVQNDSIANATKDEFLRVKSFKYNSLIKLAIKALGNAGNPELRHR